MPRSLKYPVAIIVMLLLGTGVAIATIPDSSTQAAIPDITTYWKHREVLVPADAIAIDTSIGCDDGDVASGGGFNVERDLKATGSYPGVREKFPPTAWHVTVSHTDNQSSTKFELYVVCIEET